MDGIDEDGRKKMKRKRGKEKGKIAGGEDGEDHLLDAACHSQQTSSHCP